MTAAVELLPAAAGSRVPPACDLVVLGATGDLAQRKLLSALVACERRGLLAADTRVIGVGRRDLSDDAFRAMAASSLDKHSDAATADVEALLARLSYVAVDLAGDDWDALAVRLPPGAGRVRVFYLACAPDLFGPVCRRLGAVGLVDPDARVVLEKPIGTGLASAQRISEEVAAVFEERQVFRIDHYLGKETVQNLLVLRFANAIFAPLWAAGAIDSVQITASETLGVGTRGGYYDGSGALRDMVQNHLLQMLCLVAMEPPDRLDADGIRDGKVAVLRALRPWTRESAATDAVRGQYRAGQVEGQQVPAYLDECGDPGSSTETFVALKAHIDNWRWAGVPFYLRTGKRLHRQATEIVIGFRDVPHWIFPPEAGPRVPNRLVISVQPDEGVHLELATKEPGPGRLRLTSSSLRVDADPAPGRGAGAYERLLLDVLKGDPVLFMRRDEVEAAWRWVDPLLEAWQEGAAPLRRYTAGGIGPSAAVELLARDGRRWNGDDA